ncbi:MAG: DNA-deoxyinosine glycosylase [Candidatus Izemoplasmatales bacterium]|jgi:hypoxanthine-DNA glycosylase|nr:DNA-deoxyinosine glycosylase [Candidatus Izemoplasmatales bacterium]MDD4354919.1 DNA-deoxyinosine glycosylase [Candidatus Izemoplasmatales bacterium]MDD4987742.1 DNA-deoxyinosine glycosylase [Candidatus Izemoplasmatales bacterium]MDY0372626.1 DNA-deoxyinosine glycosylase [Candidatus Izemoplasmatales bacterium]
MKSEMVSNEFEPVIFPDSRLLILGSLPSVQSRKQGFYYLHPKNRFWMVLSELFGDDFVQAQTSEKIICLKKHRIALYDVIVSCRIVGSSDQSIQPIQVSNIPALIQGTSIDRIYLNGQKAADLYRRFFPDHQTHAMRLPSTSPANASWSLSRLIEAWRVICE